MSASLVSAPDLAFELLDFARAGDDIGIASYSLSPIAEGLLRRLASIDAEIRHLEKTLHRLEGREGEVQTALEAALVNDGMAAPRQSGAA